MCEASANHVMLPMQRDCFARKALRVRNCFIAMLIAFLLCLLLGCAVGKKYV